MSINEAYEVLLHQGNPYIYNSHLERVRGGADEVASLKIALSQIDGFAR